MKTAEPKYGKAFADWMLAQDHDKAHAAETPFRFSGVMGCSRQLGYKAAGLSETNPMDGSSLAITSMGSLLHEDIQTAIAEKWPEMTFEGQGVLRDLISGHYDIRDPEGNEIVEIKTVGAYKFDRSIGLFRSPGKGKPAFLRAESQREGPSKSHICQAGFNARAHGRANVRIIYLSREAVSVKKAAEAGLDSIARFWAEWTFNEDEWGPLVNAETVRLEQIRTIVANGEIPGRQDFDDAGNMMEPDPLTHWRCDYCSQATRCKTDGPGRVKL